MADEKKSDPGPRLKAAVDSAMARCTTRDEMLLIASLLASVKNLLEPHGWIGAEVVKVLAAGVEDIRERNAPSLANNPFGWTMPN